MKDFDISIEKIERILKDLEKERKQEGYREYVVWPMTITAQEALDDAILTELRISRKRKQKLYNYDNRKYNDNDNTKAGLSSASPNQKNESRRERRWRERNSLRKRH